MCSADHSTRRSRRIRPEDQCPTTIVTNKNLKPTTRRRDDSTRSSTSSESSSRKSRHHSSSSSKTNPTSTNLSNNLLKIQRLHRKICPVTGIIRNISSDYHIYSTVLGKGHYGCVRECEHLRDKKSPHSSTKIYAVKSVDKSKIRRLDHLQREVQLLDKMDHVGIMKMVDCYEDAQYLHIVSERYTGGELFDKISEYTTPTGCFSERKSAGIIKSLLEAVAYLHENDIVHRDIKPENILFKSTSASNREDSVADIKLIDFGLSRMHRPEVDAPMTNPVGTAYYMSPELLKGKYDKSCDVWSIGTIVYILLCGYPPFNGDTDPDIFDCIKKGDFGFPEEAWSTKSEDAKNFIKLLLRMDPKSRLTAEEALDHAWIRNNTCGNENDDVNEDVTKQEELMVRIQALRLTIQKLKKKTQR